MRSSRRDRKDALRRQEQEYRDTAMKVSQAPILTLKKTNYSELETRTEAKLAPMLTTEEHPATRVPKQPAKSSIPLIVLACCWGGVGLGINAWFAWNRGSTLPDKILLSSLGFIAEAVMFFLLSQAKALWLQRQRGSFIVACAVWPVLFVFALTNSLGFASLNLSEAATEKAERITPAISDAQRRLDALSASRTSECLKRGDKCRQLEKEEQSVMEALAKAREAVSAASDPQTASAAKLVAWITQDCFHPTADDFAMLRLLLLTLLPQLGGLVLMVAKRA